MSVTGTIFCAGAIYGVMWAGHNGLLHVSSLLQQATTVLMAMCSHPMLYISSLLQQATTP